jgi:hypothetical protein
VAAGACARNGLREQEAARRRNKNRERILGMIRDKIRPAKLGNQS